MKRSIWHRRPALGIATLSSRLTYIRLRQGLIYLVTIMDWFSRYVLAWEVSVTMDSAFCVTALDWTLEQAQPEMFKLRGSR